MRTVDSTDKFWHVIYVHSRWEKTVVRQLLAIGVDAFVPCWRHTVAHKKGNYVSYPPLFPCYIFAKIARSEHIAVLNIKGIFHIVGTVYDSPEILDQDVVFLRSAYCTERVKPYRGNLIGENVLWHINAKDKMLGTLVHSSETALFVFAVPAVNSFCSIDIQEETSIEKVD